MRAVFQLPASMTSVVDAPRAVSSDASPTRPLCAVTRALDAGGDGQGGGGGRAARLEELAEVDGQQGVVNRGGPTPCVQARQRAGVGQSGVAADRGVGELARDRREGGQRPRRVGASGYRGRFGRCSLKHK